MHKSHFRCSLSTLCVCDKYSFGFRCFYTLRQQHARSSIHNYSYSMFGQLFLWHREKSATRFMICGCRCSYCLRKREIKRHIRYLWLLGGSFHCAGLLNQTLQVKLCEKLRKQFKLVSTINLINIRSDLVDLLNFIMQEKSTMRFYLHTLAYVCSNIKS